MTTITQNKKYIISQSLTGVDTIIAMIFLPILVHLVPFSGSIPLGAYLLPMFIAPLVAAFYLSPIGLVIASLVGPLLNHYLTGMPTQVMLPNIILELLFFSLMVSYVVRNKSGFVGMSALAFVLAKLIRTIVVGALTGVLSLDMFTPLAMGLKIALPGLLILTVIEIFLIRRSR